MTARSATSILLSANRKVFPRLFSAIAPYYVVNEYPKSGGTWVGQMLADALNLPFPRNRPIGLRPSICHGHFLRPEFLKNVLVVWRDPRDVMVSYYHHCFFSNELGNRDFVASMRSALSFKDYHDVQENLGVFIEYVFGNPVFPRFNWADFARVWSDRSGTCAVKYEELRREPESQLQRICRELAGYELIDSRAGEIAADHSFEAAKGRSENAVRANPDAEIGFVREGSVGGWTKYFNEETHALLVRHCGPEMKKIGYMC